MKFLAKKRRQENKTDYRKRKKFLETGKSRLVIRKTNKYILLQYIESDNAQDKIKQGLNSGALLKYGWPKEKIGSLKSLPAAYLTGFMFGRKIKEIKSIDIGLNRSTKGSRIYATIMGIKDSGCKIQCNPKIFPEKNRIETENVKGFFNKVKEAITKEK